MTLLYQPKEGSVLICDFRGYEVPEIIKIRPVIVIRRHRTNRLLVTVVPLSTTPPQTVLAHHLQLESHLQGANPVCWAKCDIVATVSLGRLDRIKSKDRHGKRTYKIDELSSEQFLAAAAKTECNT
ncbi:type II toxin-antitoxin system PemK/MazF family toxin [Pseudomonas proteolytica]|uniref:type II toxin-antitoxin system PemK/MazF family toxin n=1 Tax=Pseudomonas proteolytica TaxID=219574 RepID=UPI001475F1CE|nr:type II toxin-antitoxin system PemK/MazF family toxin [Pseudomonas proteolytica]NMZ42543.1 hypothetical protein [Pseudomonas proteolytica]